jgi:hypothetical protein
MNLDHVNENNFLLFAAKYYDNPQCHNTEEFYDDLKRFKYIKRLFIKYLEYNELRERLILNHITILYNIFGETATELLFFKLDGYHELLKPFLVLLNRMPDKIICNGTMIYNTDIKMNSGIIEALRKI